MLVCDGLDHDGTSGSAVGYATRDGRRVRVAGLDRGPPEDRDAPISSSSSSSATAAADGARFSCCCYARALRWQHSRRPAERRGCWTGRRRDGRCGRTPRRACRSSTPRASQSSGATAHVGAIPRGRHGRHHRSWTLSKLRGVKPVQSGGGGRGGGVRGGVGNAQR